jgi:RNA polymerase sigma-70 factor (ECF subfamily)
MEGMARAVDPDLVGAVASAAAGDDLAFERIVAAHHEDMRRVCVVMCHDDEVAEEAVQSAWAVAWRKLDTLQDPLHLRSWLVSVAMNEARQLLRKRSRRSLLETRVEVTRLPGGPDPAMDVGWLDLQRALADLDPDDRALLAMRYVAGFDSSELAAAIGLSPSGTRNRLERLLARLREELGDV